MFTHGFDFCLPNFPDYNGHLGHLLHTVSRSPFQPCSITGLRSWPSMPSFCQPSPNPSSDVFLWEKNLEGLLILTIQLLWTSKGLVSRNVCKQIESLCEMDWESGGMKISLASAWKQHWDLAQVPSLLWAFISPYGVTRLYRLTD